MYCIKKKAGLSFRQRAAAEGFLWWYGMQNQLLNAIRSLLFKPLKQTEVKDILLLRQGGLGDTIVAMPAILAIKKRFPTAHIHLLTHERLPGRQSVEEVMPQDTFEKLYRYQRRLNEKPLIKELKDQHYDLYIELPNSLSSIAFELRSMLLAKRAGIHSAIGFRISGSYFMSKLQEELFIFARERNRLLSIVQQELNMPEYLLQQAEHDAHEYWKSFRSVEKPGDKLIGLIIAAGRPQNAWPIANYHAVALHFVGMGYTVALIGGKQEYTQAAMIADELQIQNLCGKLSLQETAALLQDCQLVISNDTGAMHIAYEVGTPLIAIFSARDYSNKWFPPENKQNVVLRSDNVPCAACLGDSCVNNNVCINRISPAMVINEAEKLLKSLPG